MRPDSIKIHRKSADLELIYGEIAFRLPAEYLRVHSPSAEVKVMALAKQCCNMASATFNSMIFRPWGITPFASFFQTAMTQESTAGHIFGSCVTIMSSIGQSIWRI